jgi:3-dehydroquinate dehydratase
MDNVHLVMIINLHKRFNFRNQSYVTPIGGVGEAMGKRGPLGRHVPVVGSGVRDE